MRGVKLFSFQIKNIKVWSTCLYKLNVHGPLNQYQVCVDVHVNDDVYTNPEFQLVEISSIYLYDKQILIHYVLKYPNRH